MSGDLIDTTEMYLKAVYELIEEGVRPLRARLVERLEQSKPTVSETVARLERDGLLYVDSSRTICFTDEGRVRATAIMRKHRLTEVLLLNVIGIEWYLIHNEACKWEHVMSDYVEEKVSALVKQVSYDPFGNPIPYDDRGLGNDVAAASGLRSLEELLKENAEGGLYVLERIGEPLQVDDVLLKEFFEAGIQPTQKILVSVDGDDLTISVDGSSTIDVTPWMQKHLYVR